eukprot:UN28690
MDVSVNIESILVVVIWLVVNITIKYINRFHPGYFGKTGMRYFHKLKNRFYCPTINIENLWNLVGEETRKKYEGNDKEAPVVDVLKHGYHKVLSKGTLPQQPIIVKAKFFSKKAEQK